jgi:hypothetical protein
MSRQRLILAAVATVFVCGLIYGIVRIRPYYLPARPPVRNLSAEAVAQTGVTLSRVGTAHNWTINGQPVVDGLVFRAGESLSAAVNVTLAEGSSAPPGTRWTPVGPWIAGKDELDVWMRFAQEHPLSEWESRLNAHSMIINRPRGKDKTYRRKECHAPQRLGEYELQLVIFRRKFNGFGADQKTGGDVLQTARVRVMAAD